MTALPCGRYVRDAKTGSMTRLEEDDPIPTAPSATAAPASAAEPVAGPETAPAEPAPVKKGK